MKILLYGIFWTGALCALIFSSFMEWWIALALIAFLPLAVLQIAESKGVVRFEEHETRQKKPTIIDKVAAENLTDEEAAEIYGWAIVKEMDASIANLESILNEAKRQRDGFADLVKGDQK